MSRHLPLAVRIKRLLAELKVVQVEHESYRTEAVRGSYAAKNARERLHKEWDSKYDQLRWLQLQAALEAIDSDEECEGA